MLDAKVQKVFDDDRLRLKRMRPGNPEEDWERCPDWFHAGQQKMWACVKRVVLCLCGIQSGKTVSGPRWLRREIVRTAVPITNESQPPNDYLVAGPTLNLLEKKAIPEFLRVFPPDKYGNWNKASHIYTFSEEGSKRLLGFVTPITVYCGYAANPDSLAAMTIKAAWLDEAGQVQFKRDSYEEIEARAIANQARILITTTAYIAVGWLRDMYEAACGGSDDVDLVQYKTVDNPLPGIAGMVEKAQKRLPDWKFAMRYEGRYTRPPGAIYDCFDGEEGQVRAHSVERFQIPADWPLYWGMDFGPVHTCCLMFAEDPKDKKLYLYASYLPAEQGDGRRSYEDHVTAMKAKSMQYMADRTYREPVGVYGGAKNEKAHRVQYNRLGIRVQPPRYENDWVAQIEATYGVIKENGIAVFNDMHGFISEIKSYSYALDEENNVDDQKIVNKAQMHRMDALRHVIATIRGKRVETKTYHRFLGVSDKNKPAFRM